MSASRKTPQIFFRPFMFFFAILNLALAIVVWIAFFEVWRGILPLEKLEKMTVVYVWCVIAYVSASVLRHRHLASDTVSQRSWPFEFVVTGWVGVGVFFMSRMLINHNEVSISFLGELQYSIFWVMLGYVSTRSGKDIADHFFNSGPR